MKWRKRRHAKTHPMSLKKLLSMNNVLHIVFINTLSWFSNKSTKCGLRTFQRNPIRSYTQLNWGNTPLEYASSHLSLTGASDGMQARGPPC